MWIPMKGLLALAIALLVAEGIAGQTTTHSAVDITTTAAAAHTTTTTSPVSTTAAQTTTTPSRVGTTAAQSTIMLVADVNSTTAATSDESSNSTLSYTVGTSCTSNATCTGPNEYCQTITWLSPSCATGVCSCLPCYTDGDFTGGFNAGVSTCEPITYRHSLGETCSGAYYELVIPEHASCYAGTVVCDSGYTEISGACTRTGNGQPGTSCTTYDDCAGEQTCDSSWKCNCDSNFDYDGTTGRCNKKSYGSTCTDDSECQVNGRWWEGFTWDSAVCTAGTCGCGSDTHATTGYYEAKNNTKATKDICVASGATTEVTSGGACTVDPVYYGNTADVTVCASSYVCFSCPEDSGYSTGKCRSVVGTPPKSSSCPGSSGGSGTGSGSSSTSSYDYYTEAASSSTQPPSGCGACVGYTVLDSSGFYCIGDQFKVQKCGAASTWDNLPATTSLSTVPCFGKLTFTIGKSLFLLNGTSVYRQLNGSWLFDSVASLYTQFFARLRPNEATGYVFCTSSSVDEWLSNGLSIPSSAAEPFYYNGSFYEVIINASSYFVPIAKAVSQYDNALLVPYYSYEVGCSPICCWSATNWSTPVATELFYNGTFYYWAVGAYHPYSGGIVPILMGCVLYMSNYTWRSSLTSGTKYQLKRGELYETTSSGSTTLVLSATASTVAYSDMLSDAAAIGGFFERDYSNAYASTEIGGSKIVYVNATGKYFVSIVNGNFVFTRPPPDCTSAASQLSDGGSSTTLAMSYSSVYLVMNSVLPSVPTSSYLYYNTDEYYYYDASSTTDSPYSSSSTSTDDPCPALYTAQDSYQAAMNYPCNPLNSPDVCGDGYKCVAIPLEYFTVPCSLGFCMPDYSKNCFSTTTGTTKTTTSAEATTTPSTTTTTSNATTTTPVVLAQPYSLKYGSSCTYSWECMTEFCSNSSSKCSCSSDCFQVLPKLTYNWFTGKFGYKEECISKKINVGTLGEACDMWSAVPANVCGFGMVCGKCPEFWSTKYVPASCVAVTLPKDSSTNATCTPTCGHKATCSVVAGMPICTCPSGYTLEENMKDCYGWVVNSTGACSVTCGNGVALQFRTCDKLATSSAVCAGNATTTVACDGSAGQCPLSASQIAAACLIKIKTQIITVKRFEQLIEIAMKLSLIQALNAKCLSDNVTFQSQCCPGKLRSSGMTSANCINADTGVNFTSKYWDGTNLQFYVLAQGDSQSSCCASATAKQRRKRSTSDGSFDSASLASILTSQAVLASMNSLTQSVDPSASLTVTTASSSSSGSSSGSGSASAQTSSTSSGLALPIYAIGLLAGGGALIIIIVVVVVVVMVKKQTKAANKIHNGQTLMNPYAAGARPPAVTHGELRYEQMQPPRDNGAPAGAVNQYQHGMHRGGEMKQAKIPPINQKQPLSNQPSNQSQFSGNADENNIQMQYQAYINSKGIANAVNINAAANPAYPPYYGQYPPGIQPNRAAPKQPYGY